MSGTSRPAKIITFYSFKGGAGRTMAMANIAWIMASQGKSVLVVDWDLEAPGLHLYYAKYIPIADLSYGAGILDMFTAFADAANSDEALSEDTLRGLHDVHTNFERYSVDVHHPFPQGGKLHYIGPGRMDGGYASRLHGFDWGTFQTSDDGREFLAALRDRMHGSDYDYILIDSRTGFSEGAGICTLALPDTVVIGLAMNRQAIEGAREIAERITSQPRDIDLHIVPMRVDISEKLRLDRTLADARAALDPFLGVTGEDALDAYWGEVQIPYRAYFAYGEELAVMVENPRQTHTVLAGYVKAAHRITDGTVDGFEPVPKQLVEEYRDWQFRFERPADRLTMTILNAPDDQMWADWITAQLAPAGVDVVQPHPDDKTDKPLEDSLPDTDYVVALLTPRLPGTPAGRAIERLTVAPTGTAPRQKFVGLRVSTARLAPHYDLPDAASLAGLDEVTAHRVLLSRFSLSDSADTRFVPGHGPRFPGRQPDVWSLPMRNARFIGRSRQLREIQQEFGFSLADHTAPRVLYGMKGAGKRQVALEYAHRFASQYDLVWWVPATSPDGIHASLRELARAINAHSGGARSGDDLPALREELRLGRHCPRWLLVFDGADGHEVVEPFLPGGGTGHVLITSLNSQWPAEYETQQVEQFTREESLLLLGKGISGADDSALDRLADRVGDLPLLLRAAVAGLSAYPERIDDYIQLLDSREADAREEVLPGYGSIDAVYQLAFDKLRRQSVAAARLLELCAFLSPDGVGMNVIQSPAMLRLLSRLDERLRDSLRLRRVMNRLVEQELAAVDHKTRKLKVHRVVQDLVRGWMTPEERERTRAEVLGVLASMVPMDLERHESRHQEDFAELDRHVLACGALDSADPEVHRWLISQVYHRWFSGRWTAARELGELVLGRWRPARGPDDTMVLRMETQVSAACRLLGQYKAALELSSHAVRIQRERDSQDTYTLLAARGYAADLRATGRFQEAYDEDKRTYSGLVNAIGREHNGTLEASGNLAVSRFYMETVEAAVDQDRNTYVARRRLFGEDDHRPWMSYAALGTYFRELGELADSELYLTRAWQRLLELVGPDDYHYLRALASLGMTMVRKGEAQQGLMRLQDAYKGFENQWGVRHPRTMACELSIAIGLHAAGRTGDAAVRTREVFDRYVEVFGPKHPFTSICRSNLALYLLGVEDHDPALAHARTAVSELGAVFGYEHRYTLVARMNLNNCLDALGLQSGTRAAEDNGIHESCGQPFAWGDAHPVTLTALANLVASRPDDSAALRARLQHKVPECFTEGHRLGAALLAEPYHRVGADLEVQDV
jgi:cellulose biosynthesis protein BcsQ/tetratricopeptide (TPR) repeat protein